ncbi:O-antigen ligase family protein [Aliarcobacter skirrowii]|uniref:O-antigen ligase family protein n=1 Tax=Aliarcobacter skirrowii TaxID=28200 RepID=UPI0029BA8E5C|nr:O-antigen ligase family protein [Aliarcobacter skirrowii]MDX4062481.1 O-antigen ligase family protein [Aliarcobacter skirrowii]
MSVIWLFTLNYKNIYKNIRESRLFVIILILTFWIFLTCLFTNFSTNAFEIFLKYFLMPIIVISTTVKEENIKYIIMSFLFGMFANELISYGIYFEFIKDSFLGFNLTGNKNNPVPFMASHMEYTLFLSLSIIVSIFSIFSVKNIVFKLILSFFTITMVINLFLTTGRTGQFTLLGTACILLIIYFRHNYKIILSGLILIVFVFLTAYFFSENTNTRLNQGYNDIVKVIQDKNYNTSLGVRLSSYILIPKIIEDKNFNIIYGTGYCKVNQVIHQIHLKEFGENSIFRVQEGHLHNSYITIFAGTGIIGLILLLSIWYEIFKVKIKNIYFNYIRYSFLFVVFLGGFTENMFRQKEVMMMSAIFISMIIVLSTKYIEDENSEK